MSNIILLVVLFLSIEVILLMIVACFIILKRDNPNDLSKKIVDNFKPGNTAPKITKLIEFDLENKIEYKI